MICRFNKIPIKILVDFFVEIVNLIVKCIRKCKGPRIAKTILKNKIDLPYLTLKLIMIYTNQDGMIDIRVNM